MTWLFIRFYVGVLIVLFLAWYIYGTVLARRAEADTARVVVTAHGGGARLVARELDAAPPERREERLQGLRERFDYPLEILALHDLPNVPQRQISRGEDVAYCRLEQGHCVIATLSSKSTLSGDTEVVRLGPFPDYNLREIEVSLRGWMRLTAGELDAAALDERPAVLNELQKEFDFPIDITGCEDLPAWPRRRIVAGDDIVFFPQDPQPRDRWFAATPLLDRTEVVRFGPFPSFERIEQKAATTTLTLVLLPAALAIALLLRPVARQLRKVEHAAQEIAAGDLSARVDERRVRSAKSLAHAFNHMASHTESLVRTQRELLQAVSHELRTPLARIRFAIELIDTAKDDEERKQRLESLDAAAEEVDELVGELLAYVRMETVQGHVNSDRFVLWDILEGLIEKHATLYPSIQFDASKGDGKDIVVVADRKGLQRVLGNLLSNASRFAISRVAVSTESTDSATIINVDDDGNGIPITERERVLEPFVRLGNGSHGRGVGLGLALVRRIMLQHGGTVEVLTSPLGGCRVQTTWPAQD